MSVTYFSDASDATEIRSLPASQSISRSVSREIRSISREARSMSRVVRSMSREVIAETDVTVSHHHHQRTGSFGQAKSLDDEIPVRDLSRTRSESKNILDKAEPSVPLDDIIETADKKTSEIIITSKNESLIFDDNPVATSSREQSANKKSHNSSKDKFHTNNTRDRALEWIFFANYANCSCCY